MLSNIISSAYLVALIVLARWIVVLVLGLVVVIRAAKSDLPAVTHELRGWFSVRRR